MLSLTRTSKLLARMLPIFAVAVAGPASAHVSLERGEAPKGASYKAVLKLPHGCDGSPTTSVAVAIPEGFIGVKPMPKPGWTLATVRGPYAQSYAYYHGETLSDGVKEIRWSDGNLPDEYYDEFVAAGFLARELSPGATLAFKVTQTCEKGQLVWDEVAAEGQDAHHLEHPAAVLKIAAGEDNGAAHGGESGAMIGTLMIENAWARATPEGSKVAAAYFSIHNMGSVADTLVSVATSASQRAEIHDTTTTDGVMRMRRLENGLDIPAGGHAELKPGGAHLMLLDLTGPLTAGQTFTLKLGFKSGAAGEVTVPVKAIGANGGGEDHGHQH